MPRTCTNPTLSLPLLHFPGGGSHIASATPPNDPALPQVASEAARMKSRLLLLHHVTKDLLSHLENDQYLVVLARDVPPLQPANYT